MSKWVLLFVFCLTCLSDPNIDELEKRSMLWAASSIATLYQGTGTQWQNPYGFSQNEDILKRDYSVWLDLYPGSIITPDSKSVIQTISDPETWKALSWLGVRAVHTNPLRRSGGLTMDLQYTPTVDGNYDRIGYDPDPLYGTTDDYKQMTQNAQTYGNGAAIVADIIPGHTGRGADWDLALLNYKDYPGLYTITSIRPEHWTLLPDVPPDRMEVNLSVELVDKLKDLGYIVGRLPEVIFKKPGVKDTNWSVSRAIKGVDGVIRRWVYLHLFYAGQPSMNWLDPSFAANRLITGDIIFSKKELGASMLRIDANAQLGVEKIIGSEFGRNRGHPLAITSTQLIAMTIRKWGLWSYEENIDTIDSIKASEGAGADLSYDFITRTGVLTAVMSGDASLLNYLLTLQLQLGVNTARIIHALQNHDDFGAGVPHFAGHPKDTFFYKGKQWTGDELNNYIVSTNYAYARTLNVYLSNDFGVASTLVSLIGGRYGVNMNNNSNVSNRTIETIKEGMLAVFSQAAMQPGIVMLSGWDLVGSWQLSPDNPDIIPFLNSSDNDPRWLCRPAYDIIGFAQNKKKSFLGLPRAIELFGPLDKQMTDSSSFAFQVNKLLATRKSLGIPSGKIISVLDLSNQALSGTLQLLPNNDLFIPIFNFNTTSQSAQILLQPFLPPGHTYGSLTNVLTNEEIAYEVDKPVQLQISGFNMLLLLLRQKTEMCC